MIIGSRSFDRKDHTYIMAILNVTPDSFSDGGRYGSLDDIKKAASLMIRDGADIIDIGGESTRPGYRGVSADEELDRVMPALEAVKAEFEIPVSVDTMKAVVAEEAVKAGCDMINDVSGLFMTDEMLSVIESSGLPCCLMHNKKTASYNSFMEDILAEMKTIKDRAVSAGISADKIIMDPGIGFAKSYEQNLDMLGHLSDLHTLGLPILLGASRKSVIGLTLDLPADERVEGTLATTAAAVYSACSFVRVHDVKENHRFIRMLETILGRDQGQKS